MPIWDLKGLKEDQDRVFLKLRPIEDLEKTQKDPIDKLPEGTFFQHNVYNMRTFLFINMFKTCSFFINMFKTLLILSFSILAFWVHVVLLIQEDLKMEGAFGNRYLSFLIPRRHFSGQPFPCPHCFFLPSSCVLSLSQQACHSEIWVHFL